MEDDKTVGEKRKQSVRKCRDKKRKVEEDVRVRSERLKEENAGIETNIKAHIEEIKFMGNVFKAHLEAAEGSSKENPDLKEIERMVKDEDLDNGETDDENNGMRADDGKKDLGGCP